MTEKRLIYWFLRLWILVATPNEFQDLQNKRLERLMSEW